MDVIERCGMKEYSGRYRRWGDSDEEELTARPTGPAGGMPMWSNSMSIDEVLADGRNTKRDSDRLGPMTPHDYEDISPITRGEWGFLVADQSARQVAVTTC